MKLRLLVLTLLLCACSRKDGGIMVQASTENPCIQQADGSWKCGEVKVVPVGVTCKSVPDGREFPARADGKCYAEDEGNR